MGVLAAILGQNNPVAQWTAANHGWLSNVGAGIAQGPTLADGLARAAQLGPAGQLIDQQYAKDAADKQQRQDAINQSARDLQKFPDLLNAVQSGAIDPATAYGEMWKRTGQGASASADPAEVATYKFYANQETQAGRTPKSFADWTAGSNTGLPAAPSGYKWSTDGSALQPIPGGPADMSSAQSLSPEALDLISTQFLAGDRSAIAGFARNPTMRAQIANAIASKADAAGMDGKAIAAEISAYGGNVAAQRAAGTRAAQVGMAASEANQMADIALTASQAVPRGNFVPWNTATQLVAKGTSSPEMAQFVTATTSLVNAYARAVSPLGAPTDAMRQHAEAMLNTAQGPEAYAAVIDQMKKEMEAALNAPAEISKNLKSSVTGDSTVPTVPTGQPVTGKTSTGLSWSLN